MNRITRLSLAVPLLFVLVIATALYSADRGQTLDPKGLRDDLVYSVLHRLQQAHNNRFLHDVALTASTTDMTYGAASYVANAVFCTTTGGTITLSGATIPKGYYCKFLFGMSLTGTATCTQGAMRSSLPGAEYYPEMREDYAVMGGITVYAASASFVPGTSSLASSGYTVYSQDMAGPYVPLKNLP